MKTKRRSRECRDSTDADSDDDIPLKLIKLSGYADDPNSYHSLSRQSIEACEFCDHISNNRYSSLIHNMKHIIIPLLNQTFYQCEVCLQNFISQKDLTTHKLKIHPWSSVPVVDLVKLEPMPCFETVHREPRREPSVEIVEDESNVASIKNRLLFEDDDDNDVKLHNCDQLLNDLITGCKVDLEVFQTPWLNDEYKGRSVHYDDLLKPGVYICKKCGKGFPIRYEAIVHEASHIYFRNSQLNLCIMCNTYILGDRNNLRLHYLYTHKVKPTEAQNVQTYFTSYVDFIDNINSAVTITQKETLSTKMLEAKDSRENDEQLKPKLVEDRIEQSEKASPNKMVYHNKKETDCKKIICVKDKDAKGVSVSKIIFNNDKGIATENCETKQELEMHNGKNDILNKIMFSEDHVSVEDNSILRSSLMLCDLCYVSAKSKKFLKYQYVCVGELNEPGKRYICQKCKWIFNHIKLVKRDLIVSCCSHMKRKHHKSNKERLKSIRNRFKMLKM